MVHVKEKLSNKELIKRASEAPRHYDRRFKAAVYEFACMVAVLLNSHADFFFTFLYPVVLSCMTGIKIAAWYEGSMGWFEQPNIASVVFCDTGGGKTNMFDYFIAALEIYGQLYSDYTCTEFTVEAIKSFMASNASNGRGRALVTMDEFSRFSSLDKYTKAGHGDSKEQIIELLNGNKIRVLRKGSGSSSPTQEQEDEDESEAEELMEGLVDAEAAESPESSSTPSQRDVYLTHEPTHWLFQ